MKCPQCGSNIDDDSRYCDYCGTKVQQVNTLKKETQIVESNSHPKQDEGQQRHGKWLGIMALILSLMVLSIFCYIYKNPKGSGSNESNPVDTVAMSDIAKMTNQQIDSSIVESEASIKAVADPVEKEQHQKAEEEASKTSKKAKEEPEKKAKEEIDRKAKLESQVWVDLGLPSGTLWKDKNERGYFTYDEAMKKFGKSFPSNEQWNELISMCERTWTGDGYKMEGLNGNYIFLPLDDYWTSTPFELEPGHAINKFFNSSGVGMGYSYHDNRLSVRLVR